MCVCTHTWCIICGTFPLVGKTILAAEAVRDGHLLQRMCPGGVHWCSVGRMADSSGEIDKDVLLEKLQDLISELDSNQNRPRNLESARKCLKVCIILIIIYSITYH